MTESSERTPQSASPTTSATPTPRRLLRRLRRLTLFSIALLLGAWLLVSQTGVLRAVVLPQVQNALGCEADCGRVTISLSGKIVVRRLKLSTRDLKTEAAEFLTAPQLALSLDWWSLIRGNAKITSVELRRPHIRLSQGPGLTLNVSSLRASGTGSVPSHVPAIEVSDGVLELGEHTDDTYTELTSVHVRGWLRPKGGNPDQFSVNLVELDRTPGARRRGEKVSGMQLQGNADLAQGTAELQLTNLDLAQWSRRTAPSAVRDLWRTMAVTGSISEATLNYVRGEGVAAKFLLRQVDMNIPLRVEGQEARLATRPGEVGPGEERLLAMRDVSGTIGISPKGLSADLDGVIGDLRCGVVLTTEGLAIDSALRCRIGANGFKVAERPDLLPFAPYVVKKLFRRFSGPTAEVDGWVEITRANPTTDGPAPLEVAGALDLRNGRAEYEKFPYPFVNMEGHVQFDGQRVQIVRITGDGPAGAKLVATGVVEPPTENAAVAIDVHVTNVDLDHTFRDAMPPGRRGVFTTLFNEDAYAQMVHAGIVRPSSEDGALQERRKNISERLDTANAAGDSVAAAALNDELERVERAIAVPGFDLGGTASLDIHVRREFGEHTEYVTRIDFLADRAGVVVPTFPYPAVARDIRIRIGDERADIERMTLEGLSGARGELTGRVEYASSSAGDFQPYITIDVPDMPVDRLLLYALPNDGSTQPTTDGTPSLSARRLLSGMGLTGSVEGHAEIFPGPAPTSPTGFEVTVDIDGLTSQPGSGQARVEDIRGKMVITREELKLHAITGRLGDAPLTGWAHATFGNETTPSQLSAELEVHGLDLSTPIEDLVMPLTPTRADMVRQSRLKFNPSGRLNAELRLGTENGLPTFRGELSSFEDVNFATLNGRASLIEPKGTIAFTTATVEFEHFQSGIIFNDEPSGNVSLEGSIAGGGGTPSSLNIGVQNARWDSALVRALADRMEPKLTSWLIDVNLRGEFDLSAVRTTTADAEPSMTGSIKPRTLALTRRKQDIEFHDVKGALVLTETGGRIEGLTASAPAWSFNADGAWSTGEAARLDVTLGMQSSGLPADLRAALPAEVEEALTAVDIGIDESISLPGGTLSIWKGTGEELGASFSGTVAFSGLHADPAMRITDAIGTAAIQARGEPGAKPSVELVVLADSFRAGGITMTDGRLRLKTGNEPGSIELPVIEAQVHGGALSGRGVISNTPTRENPTRRSYELHADLSEIHFGELMDDLVGKKKKAKSSDDGEEAPWRGELDGSISVAGVVGELRSRTGRGIGRVQGDDKRPAEVIQLPGVMPLMRLSNLQPPLKEPLDFAFAEFHFEGPRLVFDTLSVRSQSIAIEGDGAMLLPGMELALRFNTRSLNRVVFLSDLFEGMRDELVTTVVTGTAYDPVFGYEQLSQTREFIDTALGDPKKGEQRRQGKKKNTP